MPSTRKEFGRLCEINEEGTFMVHCGMWKHVEKKCLCCRTGNTKAMTKQAKFGCFYATQNKETVNNEGPITTDEEEQHDLSVRVAQLEQRKWERSENWFRNCQEGGRRHPAQVAPTFAKDELSKPRGR